MNKCQLNINIIKYSSILHIPFSLSLTATVTVLLINLFEDCPKRNRIPIRKCNWNNSKLFKLFSTIRWCVAVIFFKFYQFYQLNIAFFQILHFKSILSIKQGVQAKSVNLQKAYLDLNRDIFSGEPCTIKITRHFQKEQWLFNPLPLLHSTYSGVWSFRLYWS